MSTTTTNYGLIKPGTDDPILVGQLNDNMDTIDTVLKDHSDKIDAASLGIKYKGEVNYYADLPNSAEIGDAYTVKYAGSSGTTPDGTEYVWGTVSGTNQWINFSKDSYTKAEVDALLALKVDTAGTGLSKSGTTLNHSNSTTAKTTQGFAQIAYDAQGHITGSTAATTAQANAINSGINSAKVEQIETNKNDILLLGYADNIINTTFDWSDGFIWTNGSINASSQSQFSQPLLLHAGEKITVKTTNKNIGIICSTTADVVRVGDSVTVLQTTSNIAQEEAYSYTATADIRIVICVLKSNYDAYVSQKSSLPLCDWITLQIRSMQST